LKVGVAVRVRFSIILLLFGALSVAAEEAAKPAKRVSQDSDESLGPVVTLQFDYASSSIEPLRDGTYSTRLHCSNPKQVIPVKFAEAGLAYMKNATNRPRVRASGSGGKFAIGGRNAYAVYGRPYTVHRRNADGASATETTYWLVGTQKIAKLGGFTYYQW
jgi:hypothetical protein